MTLAHDLNTLWSSNSNICIRALNYKIINIELLTIFVNKVFFNRDSMMHNEMFQLTKGDVISRCLISGMKK
jgi:hypothetical protein